MLASEIGFNPKMSTSSAVVTRSGSSANNAENEEHMSGLFKQSEYSSIAENLTKYLPVLQSAHYLTFFLYNFVYEISCLIITRPVQIK